MSQRLKGLARRMRSGRGVRSCATAIAAMILLGFGPRTLQAYEGDHYAWTWYLALQVGFSERQAYQIASAAYAIDWDPHTGPMGSWGDWADIAQGSPGPELQEIWLGFHAFEDNLLSELPGQVEKAKDQRQLHLLRLSREEHNPGPLIHFVQDRHAHFGWWNVRGHAFAGHLPDFPSDDPAAAWRATEETVRELILFRDAEMVGSRQFEPRSPDWPRIHEVFERLIAASPVPPLSPPSADIRGRLPHELQASVEGLAATALSIRDPGAGATWVASVLARYYPGVNLVGMLKQSPALSRSLRVVNTAVREDKNAGRLPAFPDRDEHALPPRWELFAFDREGRVPPGWVDAVFGVEKPTFEVGEPRADYVASDPAASTIQVDLRLPYVLSGLKAIQFLSPLPVIQISEVSDFGVGGRDRRSLGNGSHLVERQIRRSRADLEAGRLSWKVTVHAYGFDPVTRVLRLSIPPLEAKADAAAEDPLVELRRAVAATAATAEELSAACAAGARSLAAASATRAELEARIEDVQAEARSHAAGGAGQDRLAEAESAFRRGDDAARALARLRDEAGRSRDAACASGRPPGMAADPTALSERARRLAATLEASLAELRWMAEAGAVRRQARELLRGRVEDLLSAIDTARARLHEVEADGSAVAALLETLGARERWSAGLRQPALDAVERSAAPESERERILSELEGLESRARSSAASAPSCGARLREATETERTHLAAAESRARQIEASEPAPDDTPGLDRYLTELGATAAVAEVFVESIETRAREASACAQGAPEDGAPGAAPAVAETSPEGEGGEAASPAAGWAEGQGDVRDLNPCREQQDSLAAASAQLAAGDLEGWNRALVPVIEAGCRNAEVQRQLRDAIAEIDRGLEAGSRLRATVQRDAERSGFAWGGLRDVLMTTLTAMQGRQGGGGGVGLPIPVPTGPGTAVISPQGGGRASCLVDAQVGHSSGDAPFYVQQSDTAGLRAFKIIQTRAPSGGMPAGISMHGPYSTLAAAQGALDRLCPASQRSTGGVRIR